MAPTLAMSLTGVGPAGLIGRAAPLAFAMAVVVILALVAVIFGKLLLGGAPRDQGFTLDFVKLPPGTSFSTVALAATAGFLSFAGFESAGSFGEEANSPTRSIPRSMIVSIA